MSKPLWTLSLLLLLSPALVSQEIPELRAVWLTNVDSNVLSSDQNITEAMDYLASIGVNVVFPVVYNKGYTLYPSRIMDSLFSAPVLPGSPFVGRDFLERLCIEAHRNGMEVIPWFEFGFATSYSLNGGHILARFPSWALKTSSGALVVDNGFDWMSAVNPEAQEFMMSLLLEVLDRYDVEGVQGDDRLPAMPVEGGYDSVTAAIYKAEHAGQSPPADNFNAAWMRWRADKMTAFASRLRDSVKARGTHRVLSLAPTPYYWGYRELLQDSRTWAQQGIADNMIPQLYQYTMPDFSYALNTTWNDVGQYSPGTFAAGILARVGSYVVDTLFLGQMLTASRVKGAKGESYFFYEALRTNTNRIGTYLRARFYQTPAYPPWRDGGRWIPRGTIVNETDPGAGVTGSWSVYPMKGYEGAVLRTNDTIHPASVRYDMAVQTAAFYDVYTYNTPNTPWTQFARYTLHGDSGDTTLIVDQSDLTKKGWQKLGTIFLQAGTRPVVTVDNSLLEPDRYLVVDAAMIMLNRRLSPDVLLTGGIGPAENPTTPAGFRLDQNYPNPFNPQTTIRFTIGFRGPAGGGGPSAQGSASGMVKLAMYDVLGREVAVLVNEPKPPGTYEVRFNATGLAAGVYFCTLRAGVWSETRAMILLR